jgi:hypothetical protein
VQNVLEKWRTETEDGDMSFRLLISQEKNLSGILVEPHYLGLIKLALLAYYYLDQ